LSHGDLPRVLDEIGRGEFASRLSTSGPFDPDLRFPTLTPREDQIITMMMRRKTGMRRREVFERMAAEAGISPTSAEKYYKLARAKLLKLGRLPKGL
jgi:hypothetical protein